MIHTEEDDAVIGAEKNQEESKGKGRPMSSHNKSKTMWSLHDFQAGEDEDTDLFSKGNDDFVNSASMYVKRNRPYSPQ